MKTLKIISFFVIIVFLNACNQTGLLGEINNLEEQVSGAIIELQEFKEHDFTEQKAKAKELIDQLGPYFNKLEDDNLKVLVTLADTEKADTKFHSRLGKLEQALNYSADQLSALKTEFKNKELSQDKAREYFLEEEKIAKNLIEEFSGEKVQIEYLQDHYQEFIPKGEALIKSLTSE